MPSDLILITVRGHDRHPGFFAITPSSDCIGYIEYRRHPRTHVLYRNHEKQIPTQIVRLFHHRPPLLRLAAGGILVFSGSEFTNFTQYGRTIPLNPRKGRSVMSFCLGWACDLGIPRSVISTRTRDPSPATVSHHSSHHRIRSIEIGVQCLQQK